MATVTLANPHSKGDPTYKLTSISREVRCSNTYTLAHTCTIRMHMHLTTYVRIHVRLDSHVQTPRIRSCLLKSAHTALAVKACLLGGNSYTKCSITFVNIAVAISALAWGGKNGFAPRPDPKNGFAPRPEYGGVFDIFRGFLGV